jgi:polysulfide reductase chain C
LFAAIVFKQTLSDQEWSEWWFRSIRPLIDWFEDRGAWVEWCMCLSAISIAAYTGFLLSALVAKPLLNVPLLPLLFLISGMSAGVAASILVGITAFRDSVSHRSLKYLLSLDTKLIPTELFILFIMFIGLFNMGGQYAIVAKQALTIGVWANVFWFGIIGLGLVLPIIVALISLQRYEQGAGSSVSATPGMSTLHVVSDDLPVNTLIINSVLVLIGVVLLRFYILYAGQIFM